MRTFRFGPPVNEDLALCIHEAGHAVAAHCFGVSVTGASVTLGPIRRGGIVEFSQHDPNLTSWADVTISVSGIIAERLYRGDIVPLGKSDYDYTFAAIKRIPHRRFDCGEPLRSFRLFHDALAESDRLVRERWTSIGPLAHQLLIRGSLTGTEVLSLLRCNQRRP